MTDPSAPELPGQTTAADYEGPPPAPVVSELAQVLALIAVHDEDYEVRYPLVFKALSLALSHGYAAGVRFDAADPEWPVVYIELPTGQASWHMPQHPKRWDGHTTEEKYRRVREFVASQPEMADEAAQPFDPSLVTHLAALLRRVADQVDRESPRVVAWHERRRVVELGDPDGCGRAHRELGEGYQAASFVIQWEA